MFINKYKYTNIVENQKVFLKTILDLKPYLVKFNLEENIKNKIYPNDCQMGVQIINL